MAQALRNSGYFTVEDYLEREQSLGERCEFVNGVVYAMVGGTARHNTIAQKIFLALANQLPGTCETFIHATKLKMKTDIGEAFYYPDIMVSCDETDRDPLFRERPCLVVEVLSPSTEALDRQAKFEQYRKLPSLEHYLLVTQDVPQLEVFARAEGWKPRILSWDDSVDVCGGLATLAVNEIYDGIAFTGLKQGDF